MMTTTATRDFTSIGCLASQVQAPVRGIEKAAEKLGIVPSLRLNGVPHFDGEQVEALTIELSKGRRIEEMLTQLEAERRRIADTRPRERVRRTGRMLASGHHECLAESTRPALEAHLAKVEAAIKECRALLKTNDDESLDSIRASVGTYVETFSIIAHSTESEA